MSKPFFRYIDVTWAEWRALCSAWREEAAIRYAALGRAHADAMEAESELRWQEKRRRDHEEMVAWAKGKSRALAKEAVLDQKRRARIMKEPK